MHCRWCGNKLSVVARVCSECGHPTNLVGYATVLVSALILPATAVGIAEYLEDEERAAERYLLDRRQLTDAYQQLGAAISDFRAATVRIDSACLSTTPYRCHDELRAGVNDLDRAIDAIGPRLAPFNEYTLRTQGQDRLTETWLRCFVAPYYGTQAGDGGKWGELQAVFAGPLCSSGACDPQAAFELGAIAYQVWSGPCVDGQPEPSRSLNWFHREAQHIFFERDPVDLLPPGGELTAITRITPATDSSGYDSHPLLTDDPTQRTVPAWTAFNAGQLDHAIAQAQQCIDRFGATAELQQDRLAGTALPPVGAVTIGEKHAIFRHGELNDVASCQWIKGMALFDLGRTAEADQAFAAVSRLPHGRTWDPRGWFWSPATVVDDLRATGIRPTTDPP